MPLGINRSDEAWFQGKVRSGYAIAHPIAENLPTLSSNTNDYQLPSGADYFRISSSAAYEITGFVSPGVPYTGQIIIYNSGSFDITLKHDSVSSSVGNRIKGLNGIDVKLLPNYAAFLIYDQIGLNWLVLGTVLGVLVFDSAANFPATGSVGVTYVASDYGRQYFWTGSVYAEIGAQASALPIAKTRLYDQVSNVYYMGSAELGSAASAAVWLIKKTTINTDGSVSSNLTATNAVWDNRYTETYS